MRGDGQDDGLEGGNLRGQLQPALVPVRHDDGPDQAGGYAPAGLVAVLQVAFFGQVLHVKGHGEVGAEVVRGAGLQGLAILHHGLDRIGRPGTGKFFLLALLPGEYRDGQHILADLAVDIQHQQGLLLGLLRRRVHGVALLPPELAGAQEGAGGLFPAHHAAPLVILHRQIAPGLHPSGKHGAEDGLAGGAHGQPLLQHLVAALGHPGHLGREALHVLGLLEQQGFRDQHRHRHVLVPRLHKPPIQRRLDKLPDAVAVGLHRHGAAHGRIIHQIRLRHHVRIPLGEVFIPRCNVLYKFLLCLCHNAS